MQIEAQRTLAAMVVGIQIAKRRIATSLANGVAFRSQLIFEISVRRVTGDKNYRYVAIG